MSEENRRTVLYLRSDLTSQDIVAGGSVAHTLGVVRGFIRAGYRVLCGTSFMYDELKAESPAEMIRLSVPRVLYKLPWRITALVSNLIMYWTLSPVLKQNKIDFIYQRYTLNSLLGLLLGWKYRVPLALEYNGSEYWVDQNWAKSSWFKFSRLTLSTENLLLRRADSIVVVSDALRDELLARGVKKEKILVNPNGVDTDVFDGKKLVPNRIGIRKQLGLDNCFVFGFIGTFSIWHGIETIAEMIPLVKRQCLQAHFLLIGDGPLRSELIKEVELRGLRESVTFTGAVPQAEAQNYLSACDAYLCPTKQNADGSRFFGSPTKLFEYLSMGKPIIASDIEQVGKVLSPAIRIGSDVSREPVSNEIGILVKPNDVEGFAEAAKLIASGDPDFRQAMGAHAREYAIRNCTWNSHVKRISEFLFPNDDKQRKAHEK